MTSVRNITISLLMILAVIVFILTFIGGPDYYAPRSYQYAWNLGHIIAFFLWTYLFLFYFSGFNRYSFLKQIFFFAIIAVLLGSVIELIQNHIGRSANWNDVINDVLGSMLAVCLSSFRHRQQLYLPRLLLSISIILAIGAHNKGLAIVLMDDYFSRQQFPILSDFSTPFELSRWQGGLITKLADNSGSHAQGLLEINFTTERYSSVSLQYFPHDWRGYTALQIDYYNPSAEVISITCRIHDRTHVKSKQSYDDRFNKEILLTPGWNNFQVSIEEIFNAPKTRRMELSDIIEIGIFVSQQQQPRTLYIGEVKLVR